MDKTVNLGRKDIAELWQLCKYLDSIPYKSAYDLATRPTTREISYWTTAEWKAQRQYADCIFYTNGWGWRLQERWKERLAQLEAELPAPDAAVLGGTLPQPRADDAVLGGRCEYLRKTLNSYTQAQPAAS
ncbi:MAG TPA: hypothetical protein V6D14_17000 [Coleofasciculaceae cyanobacterium]|jgi:hypothetical protein